MVFYVYILFSESGNKYYIGYSENPEQRLLSHNIGTKNSYTSKFRPWFLKAVINVGESESLAMRVERYIKNRKSISFNKLCIAKQNDIEFIKWLKEKVSA